MKKLFPILITIIFLSTYADASQCSFNKEIQRGDEHFSINSRRANGCEVQILNISASKKGGKTAKSRVDLDYLAYFAEAVDLDGDSVSEIVVFSRNFADPQNSFCDIYKISDSKIERKRLPEINSPSELWLDGKQISRTYIVTSPNSVKAVKKIEKYELVKGKPELYVVSESDIEPDEIKKEDNTLKTDAAVANKVETASVNSEIKSVEILDGAILLRTNGKKIKFKEMKLEKPERIALDFQKGGTNISEKAIKIGKFGITKIRIGKNRGFLRFVLDTKEKKFPVHQTSMTDDGLKIEFEKGDGAK